jgi:hypothetical protein
VEHKSGLSYLSWSWAVDQLLRYDPDASWRYDEPKVYADTLMVFCTVKAFGRERTAQLPVMDHNNKAIPNPDSFQVNTAMQRALAKAIALHGLGLYIYAGEDLPNCDKSPEKAQAPATTHPIVAPATPAQIRYLERLIKETGHDLAKLLAYYGAESLDKLTKQSASRAIKSLEKTKEAA